MLDSPPGSCHRWIRMNDEVQLFACMLIDRQILDTATAMKLKRICNENIELLDFGEKVLEHVCDDVDLVQELLDQTCDDYDAGKRPEFDPFKLGVKRADKASKYPFSSVSRPVKKKLTRPPMAIPGEGDEAGEAKASAPGSKPSLKLEVQHTDPQADSDLASLDIGALANLAVQSIQEGGDGETFDPASAEPGAIRVEIKAGTKPGGMAATDKSNRPSDATISAKGVQPGLPEFDRLTNLTETQTAATMLAMLLYGLKQGYSDLHISAEARPFARKHGTLDFLSEAPLPGKVASRLATSLLSPQQKAYFQKFKDYDFAMQLDNGCRFRVNLMQHKDGVKGTFRIVPPKPLPLDKLGFGMHAQTIRGMLAYHNGLILVTGPVGCGKTTTLASMILELNQNRADHIITVEDPIEIIHKSAKCSVTQRGIGPHTDSYRSALKGALRQDPDIIVIGEMRDLETIEMAVSASETGHLVIGTMHTSDSATTLNRILDVFPPAQQNQIRSMVAESLRGVICQRLLPATNGGTALACELLAKNSAVASLIREGKQQGLANIIETSKSEGMVLMDTSVMELWREGLISQETALENLRNEIFRRQITGGVSFEEPVAAEPVAKKKGLFR